MNKDRPKTVPWRTPITYVKVLSFSSFLFRYSHINHQFSCKRNSTGRTTGSLPMILNNIREPLAIE